MAHFTPDAQPWTHQSKFLLLYNKAEEDMEARQKKCLQLYVHFFLRRKCIICAQSPLGIINKDSWVLDQPSKTL